MNQLRSRIIFFGFVAILGFATSLFAEDISIVIKKQIEEIARLGINPQASDADKLKMQELYQSLQAQGLNVGPVIEDILKSKGNVAEKQISLYLAGIIFAPRTIEETETKGKRLTEYLEIGLADESEQVRGYALQMMGAMSEGLWRGDSASILARFFATEKNTQFRIYALSRVAGFMTDAAYQLITEAMNDPDPAVQQAAALYKAHQDEMRKPAQ